MDPKPKDPCSAGGDLDEDTIAKKRSRRVSFAETTAVHVFDRDEDCETPPDSKPSATEGSSKPGSESLGFEGDQSDSDDSKGSTREEEEEEEQERFVRDMDLSSPGSAVGSVTSNDDDNFFGPVSTSFINSGQLSEAGMSDDKNHDITLDSTAFSLHFRNVAPTDDCSANSAGSLRSPTEDSVPTDSRGFIVPKGFKKQVPRSKLSDEKLSGSAGDSSSMSLVVENQDRYEDYGKMSPALESLLAEANRRMQPNSPISGSRTVTSKPHNDEVAVVKESGKDEAHIGSLGATGNRADEACLDSHLSKGCSMGIDTDRIGKGIPSLSRAESLPIDASTNEKTLVHHEIFRDQVSGSKHYSNSSPESVPILPALVIVDGQQQLLVSEYGMHTPKNAVQPLQSPLQGSVSSLHAKRQQLFLDPAALSQTRLMHTPDKEQPPSSFKMELTRFGERISAIKNHISKSKILKSPIIIESGPALSGKDSLPLVRKGTLEKTNDYPNIKHMGVSAINIDDNLNVVQEASGRNISLELNHLGFQIADNASVVTHLEKNEVVGETVELTKGISSYQLSQLGINMKLNLLTPDNPTERVCTPNVHNSSLRQATFELKESSQVVDTLRNDISSPIRMPGDKLSASLEGYFSPRADGKTGSSSSLEENRLQPSTSFTIPNSNKVSKLQSPKEVEKNNIPFYKVQKQIESSRNLRFGSQDKNTEMKKNLVNTKDKLFVRETASSNELSFEYAYKETSTVNKSMEFLAEETDQSPNNKVNSDNNMQNSFNLMELVPSKPTQDPKLCDHDLSYQDLQSVRESHSVQDKIIGKKRGIKQIILTDKDHVSEMSRIQKSPKVLLDVVGSNSGISSGHRVECNNEAQGIGGQASQKHWTDILFKVSEATKQLFSPSICKLNSPELDILEDTLGKLQTARKYESLCTSLRNHNCLGDMHQKRVAEARSLLDKLVFEKAKLQLKRVKLDKLSNKAQLCKSRIQECDKLKSIYSQLGVLGARIVQIQERQLHSVSSNCNRRNQEEYNRVTSMRQELELLDQKVKRLMKSFEASCKIKGNMNCDGIIEVVNDHLAMRNCCRVIKQDLQLWKLSDVVKKNDQCNIVLDYCNLLSHRFTINSGSVSSIVANNFLNDASIEKNFPNMNACIAFEFVFNAKGERKVASSKHLPQETMEIFGGLLPGCMSLYCVTNEETNLLLGTLLDVLEEVLFSRMELWNLISSTFHSHCCQLELQLCFLSFKSGRKVTLSLNVTGLNCAAYPSEPSVLQIRIFEAQTTLPPLISDEIMGAIQSLQSGRSMIARLCQSISQVVQASN